MASKTGDISPAQPLDCANFKHYAIALYIIVSMKALLVSMAHRAPQEPQVLVARKDPQEHLAHQEQQVWLAVSHFNNNFTLSEPDDSMSARPHRAVGWGM